MLLGKEWTEFPLEIMQALYEPIPHSIQAIFTVIGSPTPLKYKRV